MVEGLGSPRVRYRPGPTDPALPIQEMPPYLGGPRALGWAAAREHHAGTPHGAGAGRRNQRNAWIPIIVFGGNYRTPHISDHIP